MAYSVLNANCNCFQIHSQMNQQDASAGARDAVCREEGHTKLGQQGSNGATWHILKEDIQCLFCLLGALCSSASLFMSGMHQSLHIEYHWCGCVCLHVIFHDGGCLARVLEVTCVQATINQSGCVCKLCFYVCTGKTAEGYA